MWSICLDVLVLFRALDSRFKERLLSAHESIHGNSTNASFAAILGTNSVLIILDLRALDSRSMLPGRFQETFRSSLSLNYSRLSRSNLFFFIWTFVNTLPGFSFPALLWTSFEIKGWRLTTILRLLILVVCFIGGHFRALAALWMHSGSDIWNYISLDHSCYELCMACAVCTCGCSTALHNSFTRFQLSGCPHNWALSGCKSGGFCGASKLPTRLSFGVHLPLFPGRSYEVVLISAKFHHTTLRSFLNGLVHRPFWLIRLAYYGSTIE